MFLRRAGLAAIVLALVLTACSREQRPRENVQPPRPGIPATGSDVAGIYRSIHQGVLQLRANGDLSLIIPDGIGATSGTFTLTDGLFEVHTDNCGGDLGTYRLAVTGKQLPGQASLVIVAVQDQCVQRRRYLTVDPWIYAVS